MRPKQIAKLKHDRLLTKGNYPTFVETFNYAVERIDRIAGDKDLDPQNGTIRVDNTDPQHPVIRCDRPVSGGGGLPVSGDSDLSGVGLSSVHVADLSGAQYVQLYKFDETPTEQTGAKIDNPQGTFEIGSGDWFLVKNGDELHYKKIVLSTDLSGGGGGGGGSISVDSDIASLNSNSLQHVNSSGNDYYELYGFHDPTNTQTSLSGYEYVVRHTDGNGNVQVKYLSAEPAAAAACPASFDYYMRPDGTYWLRGGYFQQARRFYWVSSTEITAPGMIQLSVSMEYTSRSGIIQGASSLPSPNVSAMYIPLWDIGQDMKPTWDYRHAPMLPRWE